MSVEADMEAVERSARRGELGRMLYREARVRVVNPLFPDEGWTGRLHSLLDEPALMLVRDDGVRQMLPQSFAIEELDEPAPPTRMVTEWCVWWGGEDPNECAGLLGYDDQAEAEEMLQWIPGARVASRTVTRSRWRVAS